MTMQEKGFTLLELIIALALIGILAAFAVPDFLTWSRNAKYRETAGNIMAALNTAHSLAISTNLEYRVVFEVNNNRYRIERGNRYANSVWPGTADVAGWTGWVNLPPQVSLRETDACNSVGDFNHEFNPNGTSTAGHLCVMAVEPDATREKFVIAIHSTATGRAVIDRRK